MAEQEVRTPASPKIRNSAEPQRAPASEKRESQQGHRQTNPGALDVLASGGIEDLRVRILNARSGQAPLLLELQRRYGNRAVSRALAPAVDDSQAAEGTRADPKQAAPGPPIPASTPALNGATSTAAPALPAASSPVSQQTTTLPAQTPAQQPGAAPVAASLPAASQNSVPGVGGALPSESTAQPNAPAAASNGHGAPVLPLSARKAAPKAQAAGAAHAAAPPSMKPKPLEVPELEAEGPSHRPHSSDARPGAAAFDVSRLLAGLEQRTGQARQRVSQDAAAAENQFAAQTQKTKSLLAADGARAKAQISQRFASARDAAAQSFKSSASAIQTLLTQAQGDVVAAHATELSRFVGSSAQTIAQISGRGDQYDHAVAALGDQLAAQAAAASEGMAAKAESVGQSHASAAAEEVHEAVAPAMEKLGADTGKNMRDQGAEAGKGARDMAAKAQGAFSPEVQKLVTAATGVVSEASTKLGAVAKPVLDKLGSVLAQVLPRLEKAHAAVIAELTRKEKQALAQVDQSQAAVSAQLETGAKNAAAAIQAQAAANDAQLTDFVQSVQVKLHATHGATPAAANRLTMAAERTVATRANGFSTALKGGAAHFEESLAQTHESFSQNLAKGVSDLDGPIHAVTTSLEGILSAARSSVASQIGPLVASFKSGVGQAVTDTLLQLSQSATTLDASVTAAQTKAQTDIAANVDQLVDKNRQELAVLPSKMDELQAKALEEKHKGFWSKVWDSIKDILKSALFWVGVFLMVVVAAIGFFFGATAALIAGLILLIPAAIYTIYKRIKSLWDDDAPWYRKLGYFVLILNPITGPSFIVLDTLGIVGLVEGGIGEDVVTGRKLSEDEAAQRMAAGIVNVVLILVSFGLGKALPVKAPVEPLPPEPPRGLPPGPDPPKALPPGPDPPKQLPPGPDPPKQLPPGPDPPKQLPPGPDPPKQLPPGPEPPKPAPVDPNPPEPQPPAPKPPEPQPPAPKPPEPQPPGPKPPEPQPPGPKPPEPEPPAPKPLEPQPPPKDAEGNFDFTGRKGAALARDADAKPYSGESEADAAARARQAQAEVNTRLPDLQPCFVAGTPVLTPSGFTPIEELSVGAMVLGMDPVLPETMRPYLVTAVFRGESAAFCRIETPGQTLTATLNHYLYALGRGWTQARDLHTGDLLVDPKRAPILITEVERLAPKVLTATYNLRIAEVSTYFVGDQAPVLVHNDGPDFDRTLWWILGNKAKFRPTDVDGVSLWKTNNAEDVKNLFRVRKGIEGRSSSDPHQAYTPEELAAKGITVEETGGSGPLNGVLQHGSARPADAAAGDLSPADIQTTVNGINESPVAVKTTPAKMGCK